MGSGIHNSSLRIGIELVLCLSLSARRKARQILIRCGLSLLYVCATRKRRLSCRLLPLYSFLPLPPFLYASRVFGHFDYVLRFASSLSLSLLLIGATCGLSPPWMTVQGGADSGRGLFSLRSTARTCRTSHWGQETKYHFAALCLRLLASEAFPASSGDLLLHVLASLCFVSVSGFAWHWYLWALHRSDMSDMSDKCLLTAWFVGHVR